ncbi:MAG: hypothetical protein COZ06_10760 [Armatimonadetes bacterium CG_4_10_14_3_um_filter_66_18]|nr:competence/damage-inducible protein A [Armatimonadota bacterium]OIP06753.1 MAG: hypothetical protein AUJ96_08485 [Armatimonadetes bacterium CG2_30_66_41]PIU94919.1 MAG: hypothetical protein COS65_05110 [Armatimonadetes bacterium CG06_land_8_20_14_3_00_66_21]PIX40248.1 MAG: hypothetical protein COZ57_26385 [Armatimonadetes bacterium CG_4_8_14_3_um_filter_66_20]PIY50166.1 MAG: hypothetical protein COZ06_10760 [Armatimonadetes bacterium CG_4_10_14_3_um_filter_66_18]PIZ30200.1 MAG: hypothetical
MSNSAKVEIIAVGSELVSGLIQDTNSAYLAARVTEQGGEVSRITVLPDSREDMLEVFEAALRRQPAVVLVCGGLGPTPDDMTVEVLCAFAGVDGELHEPLLQEFMKRRGFTRREQITANLLKMATVPRGSAVHTNPAGWAPCVELTRNGTTFYLLPGPPRELQALFSQHLSEALARRSGQRRVSRRVAVTMHESEVSPHLETVMAEFPRTYLKAYVALRQDSEHALPVDVVCVGQTEESARDTVGLAVARLRELVEGAGKALTVATG